VFVALLSIIFTSRFAVYAAPVEVLAHGGTPGLIAELSGIVAIAGLWGWVWWRSRGAPDEDELAADDEAAVEERRSDRE
jgi:hypothetical protein